MALDKHQIGNVIYVDFGRSKCPKVEDDLHDDVKAALNGTIYSDAYCTVIAERLNQYWQNNPKIHFSGIRYDTKSKHFILTPRTEAEFPMAPNVFYELLRTKYQMIAAEAQPESKKPDSLIVMVSARLGEEIRKTLK